MLVPIASYKPFPQATPRDLPPWVPLYLTAFAENGKETLSANTAGISVRLVRLLRSAHPGFAEAEEDAKAFYLDRLEASLPGTSKPIGTIARLKADRADRFETALIVAKANGLADTPPPPGLEELMKNWPDEVTDVTLASLAEDHDDPGCAFLWESLTPEQQAKGHRALAELRASIAGDVIVETTPTT